MGRRKHRPAGPLQPPPRQPRTPSSTEFFQTPDMRAKLERARAAMRGTAPPPSPPPSPPPYFEVPLQTFVFATDTPKKVFMDGLKGGVEGVSNFAMGTFDVASGVVKSIGSLAVGDGDEGGGLLDVLCAKDRRTPYAEFVSMTNYKRKSFERKPRPNTPPMMSTCETQTDPDEPTDLKELARFSNAGKQSLSETSEGMSSPSSYASPSLRSVSPLSLRGDIGSSLETPAVPEQEEPEIVMTTLDLEAGPLLGSPPEAPPPVPEAVVEEEVEEPVVAPPPPPAPEPPPEPVYRAASVAERLTWYRTAYPESNSGPSWKETMAKIKAAKEAKLAYERMVDRKVKTVAMLAIDGVLEGARRQDETNRETKAKVVSASEAAIGRARAKAKAMEEAMAAAVAEAEAAKAGAAAVKEEEDEGLIVDEWVLTTAALQEEPAMASAPSSRPPSAELQGNNNKKRWPSLKKWPSLGGRAKSSKIPTRRRSLFKGAGAPGASSPTQGAATSSASPATAPPVSRIASTPSSTHVQQAWLERNFKSVEVDDALLDLSIDLDVRAPSPAPFAMPLPKVPEQKPARKSFAKRLWQRAASVTGLKKKKVSKGKMPLSPTDPRSIEVDEEGIGYRV